MKAIYKQYSSICCLKGAAYIRNCNSLGDPPIGSIAVGDVAVLGEYLYKSTES